MEEGRILVTIVEDNHSIRKNLCAMVESDPSFLLLADYSNAEDALKNIPDLDPNIVIMDIDLPGMNGIECVKKLRYVCPKTQFMMFTVFEESDHVFQALASGANGYLVKTSSTEEIIASLKELCAGGSPMSPLIARKVVTSFRKLPADIRAKQALSNREMEILQLLSEGLLYKEISDDLGITLGTVKQHLHRIYEKLHVNNKTEAINRVFRKP
ncbi:MAG: response regulator transcription factor [Flavobacteriales bacterium]|nr:response regulator transcription factor [Flavobacteriales bacterium]